MASVDVETASADPGLPDYLCDPNAVLKDNNAKWRYGRAPDYSNTRKVYEETKKMTHVAGSLPELVQNLVKNWEVEASFKPSLSDWRTIDHKNYSFAINGGPPQTAEHMLKVGTYNAIICPNEYYSPEHSDFASSHKTFKRMMPTFAWEVLEVYSGPPQVAFRWRHWGTMKNDYVGFNDKGEKVTAKAHGGPIDIEGVTVATVDDKVRLQNVQTWFDPMEMFRQIAPSGVVNKETISEVSITLNAEDQTEQGPKASQNISGSDKELTELQLDGSVENELEQEKVSSPQEETRPSVITSVPSPGRFTSSSNVNLTQEVTTKITGPSKHIPSTLGGIDQSEHSADSVHPHPKDMEARVKPESGAAVAAAPDSEEARLTYEEMSKITSMECPFLMNRE